MPDPHPTPSSARRTRRAFLTDLGRTTAGLVVVSSALTACTTTGDPVVASSPGGSEGGSTTAGTAAAQTGAPGASPGTASPTVGLVDLGFVAAYVLQRDGQAVVIDTGVEGSEDAILQILDGMGLGWTAVSDVVLTHSHGDHAGSLSAVATAAPDAALWAGEPDIPQMSAPRPISPVGEGDTVGDLQVIPTPGHTPGHISLYHPDLQALFTGDALTGADGRVAAPSREFTPDMATAITSVARMAALEPQQILVCHGFPVDASAADLTALAQTLQG